MPDQPSPQIPMLDLDLLKTVVAISETGNFSEAAKVVFRTPSAISMQVKRIEELLGRPIFVRTPRQVSLNEDGRILLVHARRVLALNRDIVSQFVTPEVSGTVRLGAIDHATEQFLTSVLRRFSLTHPGVTVDVTVENSDILIGKFLRNELDVIIVTCDSQMFATLDAELLFRERLVWAGLKGGSAVEQNPLPVSVWDEGCVWRNKALVGLDEQNRDYRITFQSVHIAGQKAGMMADLAIAPFPISALDEELVEVDSKYRLPDLGNYSLSMAVRENSGCAVEAVADSFRTVFADKSNPKAA